jgi:uncharacterized protein
LKIIIAGGGGFLGSNLKKVLTEIDHQVVSISRYDLNSSLENLIIKIKNADIIINLAGASIIKRWTIKNKKRIYYSRIETTRKLCIAISLLNIKPKMFISASAVGIYQSEGIHSENSESLAGDFLGQVCKDWEKEAITAQYYSNLVIFRFGIILGKTGGSFSKMIMPFKFFVGGKIANGNQGFSWIHLDDVLNAFLFVIKNQGNYGVLNLCAPNPITNIQFTKAVSNTLKRPAIFKVPAFLLKLLYGDAAVLFTKGQFVLPEKLTSLGFIFKYPEISKALKELLGKK